MARLFCTILVPHDLSPHAGRALAVAGQLARSHGARLIVLHVMVPSAGIVDYPGTEKREGGSVGDLIAAVRQHLEELVARTVTGRPALRIECRVALGDPFQCILEAARKVDLIVMATVGRSGLGHLLIGSVAEKTVRHSPVPVLTVRPAAQRGGAGTAAGSPAPARRTPASIGQPALRR